MRALVPTREDARDVMQEVTVVLWRKIGELSAMEDFRCWAFGVARMEALFGLFCASVTWAMIGTRATGSRINVSLLDESFENPQMNWPEGFPTRAGSWSGERGQVVGGTDELTPWDGKFMLRLDPSGDDDVELSGSSHRPAIAANAQGR